MWPVNAGIFPVISPDGENIVSMVSALCSPLTRASVHDFKFAWRRDHQLPANAGIPSWQCFMRPADAGIMCVTSSAGAGITQCKKNQYPKSSLPTLCRRARDRKVKLLTALINLNIDYWLIWTLVRPNDYWLIWALIINWLIGWLIDWLIDWLWMIIIDYW